MLLIQVLVCVVQTSHSSSSLTILDVGVFCEAWVSGQSYTTIHDSPTPLGASLRFYTQSVRYASHSTRSRTIHIQGIVVDIHPSDEMSEYSPHGHTLSCNWPAIIDAMLSLQHLDHVHFRFHSQDDFGPFVSRTAPGLRELWKWRTLQIQSLDHHTDRWLTEDLDTVL